jgi:hypothetical protein
MAAPFCFRPSPDLAARIDAAADGAGVSRAQWLAEAAEEKLAPRLVEAGLLVPERVEVEPGSDAFRAAAARRLGR